MRAISASAAKIAIELIYLEYQGDAMEATSGIEPEYTVLQTVA